LLIESSLGFRSSRKGFRLDSFGGYFLIDAWLDSKHVVFEQIVEGLDVVREIGEVGS
jgi:cyclophilin family peptidyl-prolyl cis-trans isomerase